MEYRHLTEAVPWSIHVVSFDLAQCDLAVMATVGKGVNGSETVPQMATELPPRLGQPLAAVNGDYFEFLTEPRYRGTLQGLCIVNGELVSGAAGSAFWIDEKKQPHIGRVQASFTVTWPNGVAVPFGLNCSTTDYKSKVRAADVVLYTPAFGPSTNTEGGREYVLEPVNAKAWLPLRANARLQARVREVRTAGNTPLAPGSMVLSTARAADDRIPPLAAGETVTISAQLTPGLPGVRTAVSGDPLLLTGGKIVPELNNTARAPRTAVGFAGTRCCFVVVDGRQPALSVGMSHRELAELMLRLGCTEAVNLDGGGSSTCWYQGKVVNSPSGSDLRPVGNALVLVQTQ
ncbi:MAG: phosphodiester glycosidase family protein [Armatimonadota bacterium]